MGIVHLKMIDVFIALKLFKDMWSGKKVPIKCDKLCLQCSGRTKESF